jgi:hypothetical protein
LERGFKLAADDRAYSAPNHFPEQSRHRRVRNCCEVYRKKLEIGEAVAPVIAVTLKIEIEFSTFG